MWFILLFAVGWIGPMIGLSGMIVYALCTGRLPNRAMTVLRDETPKTFWCLVCAYILLIAGMVYGTWFVLSMPGLSGVSAVHPMP